MPILWPIERAVLEAAATTIGPPDVCVNRGCSWHRFLQYGRGVLSTVQCRRKAALNRQSRMSTRLLAASAASEHCEWALLVISLQNGYVSSHLRVTPSGSFHGSSAHLTRKTFLVKPWRFGGEHR